MARAFCRGATARILRQPRAGSTPGNGISNPKLTADGGEGRIEIGGKVVEGFEAAV